GRTVSGHVGEDERDEARGRLPSEPASLDRGKGLAQTVDLGDRGPAPHEPADRPTLRLERQSGARHGEERRGSAGDQAEDDVPRSEAPEEVDGPAGRADARSVRLGMRGEKDLHGGQSAVGIAPGKNDERAAPPGGRQAANHRGSRFSTGEDTHAVRRPEKAGDPGSLERPRHRPAWLDAAQGLLEEAPEDLPVPVPVHPPFTLLPYMLWRPVSPVRTEQQKEKSMKKL